MKIFKEIAYYEKNILENRNEKASFYTNKEVAFFIIDELLKDLSKEQINKLSILEPSNWLWIFIFSLLDYLYINKWYSPKELFNFFLNNITTVEIDKKDNENFLSMVENFFISLDKDLKKEIKKVAESLNYNISFFDLKDEKFDIILWNPPYGISLKDDKKGLSKLYKDISGLSTDSYGLFFLYAYYLLKDNGNIAFITPDSFLNNKTFLPLRKIILNDINKVVLCPKNIFHNPYNWLKAWISTAITFIQKGSKKDFITIVDNQELKYKQGFSFKTDNEIILKKKDIENIKLLPISKWLGDEVVLSLLTNKKLKTVSDYFYSAMWIKTGDNKRFILEKQEKNSFPFYKWTSKESQKYVSTECWYLNLEYLKENKFKNSNIPQKKFLNLNIDKIGIPEIGHQWKICAFKYKEWYVSNSIWIYLLKENAPYSIDFFLDLFNSKVYEKISMVYSNWLRLEKSQIDILPIIEKET